MKTMGKRIKQKREELGLTLEELGQQLGVNKSTVSKWERGEVENIKRSLISKMSTIFHVAPDWLMGFEGSENVNLTYYVDGREPVHAVVDQTPIIGTESQKAQRALLYKVALEVKPENLQTAINILKSLI